MNPRILVIQTSPRASGLADLLASSPYEVTRAATQAAALRQAFGDAPPDLVLLDVDRADAQVLELIRLLKARSQPRFVPVLVLSAEGALETRVAALRAGADDFLRPTLHPAETLARIAAMLRIQASQDRLQEATAALVELSVTDHLTGLYNRRHFQERLTQELSRARRYGSPLSLLLMDLDHFKHVNDRFGHQAGDVALRQTAALVRPALRTLDLCARLGGEEFAVIMPTTDGAGALTVAERLRHAIAAAPLLTATEIMKPGVNPVEVRITASFGVSCLAGGSSRSGTAGSEADELLRAADAALYRAKRQGRNATCLSPVEQLPAPVHAGAPPQQIGPIHYARELALRSVTQSGASPPSSDSGTPSASKGELAPALC